MIKQSSDLYTDEKLLNELEILTLNSYYGVHKLHVDQIRWLINYVFNKRFYAGYSERSNEDKG